MMPSRYRDGLMIALLAFIPPRRKNLAALEIGRHLVREGDSWFVIIPREETKTRTSIEFPVPELLEHISRRISISFAHECSGDPTCAALWLNSRGGALAYAKIGDIISRHSMTRLGLRITAHDVRDAAATTWAIFKPEQIGVARDLLGHSDLRTTTKYYNRARGIEVSRAHNQLIAAIRRKRHRRSS